MGDARGLQGELAELSPSSNPTAALEGAEDNEALLIEDTLSNHTDLTDSDPVTYAVQKQFMR